MNCFFCKNDINDNTDYDSQIYFDCRKCMNDYNLTDVCTVYQDNKPNTFFFCDSAYEVNYHIKNNEMMLWIEPQKYITLEGMIFTPANMKEKLDKFKAFL